MTYTIYSTSDYLECGYDNGPTFNGIAEGSGNMRYNPQRGAVQTYNGSAWVDLSQGVPIGLTQEATDIMAWAKNKMEQEANLKDALERHPGLKDAYEKFEIMKTLCVR